MLHSVPIPVMLFRLLKSKNSNLGIRTNVQESLATGVRRRNGRLKQNSEFKSIIYNDPASTSEIFGLLNNLAIANTAVPAILNDQQLAYLATSSCRKRLVLYQEFMVCNAQQPQECARSGIISNGRIVRLGFAAYSYPWTSHGSVFDNGAASALP